MAFHARPAPLSRFAAAAILAAVGIARAAAGAETAGADAPPRVVLRARVRVPLTPDAPAPARRIPDGSAFSPPRAMRGPGAVQPMSPPGDRPPPATSVRILPDADNPGSGAPGIAPLNFGPPPTLDDLPLYRLPGAGTATRPPTEAGDFSVAGALPTPGSGPPPPPPPLPARPADPKNADATTTAKRRGWPPPGLMARLVEDMPPRLPPPPPPPIGGVLDFYRQGAGDKSPK